MSRKGRSSGRMPRGRRSRRARRGLRRGRAQADAQDHFDQEGVATSRVIRVRSDAIQERGAELEKPGQLLARRKRLRRAEIASSGVLRFPDLKVTGDETR